MEPPKFSAVRATRLSFYDETLGRIALPGDDLVVTRGVGSGLTRRAGDPPDKFWAIGDRGPNFKVPFGIKHYGLKHLTPLAEVEGVKIMPFPDIGPAISELRLENDRIICVRTLPLRDTNNHAISGLPFANGRGESTVDLNGDLLPANPSGADTEGIAAMADGTFWVADEYGPSLLHVAEDGTVLVRWVPEGSGHLFKGAGYPIVEALPSIAARRQFNRGFEAVTLSVDEAWLYVAFQSPLAHPDEDAHRKSRHVRIWKLSAQSGAVSAQFLYPLDKPSSFRRDNALSKVHASDLKVSEFVTIGPDRLLVLERGSATTKFYTITLDADFAVNVAHLSLDTRPTIENLSAARQIGGDVPQLVKTLIFSTDDCPEMDADLEGVIMLSPHSLLIVNDSDFGVEGASTHFWRVDLPTDL